MKFPILISVKRKIPIKKNSIIAKIKIRDILGRNLSNNDNVFFNAPHDTTVYYQEHLETRLNKGDLTIVRIFLC